MILLSFDIEEFDVPREKGLDLSFEKSMQISKIGFKKILQILKANEVQATMFCTSNFVKNASDLVKQAIADGHEIACHGVDHWNPKEDDPKISKEIIEAEIGMPVFGYRQPRMFKVDEDLIEACGYKYNSSINPAFIPGKYMHLDIPRTAFKKGNVLQIPASVTKTRIPMFWLALHTYPLPMYLKMASKINEADGYFMTYFHPWEFVNHPKSIKKYMLPIVNHNNGTQMCNRLDKLIKYFKNQGEGFSTISGYFFK